MLGAYGISKAADMQMARNLAVEWGPRNVRVNCIAPGLVRTDFARALWENPAIHDKAVGTYPLRRIGEPEGAGGRRRVPRLPRRKLHHGADDRRRRRRDDHGGLTPSLRVAASTSFAWMAGSTSFHTCATRPSPSTRNVTRSNPNRPLPTP